MTWTGVTDFGYPAAVSMQATGSAAKSRPSAEVGPDESGPDVPPDAPVTPLVDTAPDVPEVAVVPAGAEVPVVPEIPAKPDFEVGAGTVLARGFTAGPLLFTASEYLVASFATSSAE
jgi:hypothetical protein